MNTLQNMNKNINIQNHFFSSQNLHFDSKIRELRMLLERERQELEFERNLLYEEKKNAKQEREKYEKAANQLQKRLAEMERYDEIDISEITLIEEIGSGTFGKVFLGKWRGKQVAVKKINSEFHTQDYLEIFRGEVHLMSKTRHPNVILFMGAHATPPNIFLVVEYMQGGNLYDAIRRKNFDISENNKIRIALDIALGMNYLHSFKPKMIIHRDLKSLNVLLDEHGNAKVADFGLSRLKSESNKHTSFRGSPCWMAPEIFRNEPYNEKADVYSYAIVLWELCTRSFPYVKISDPIQIGLEVGYHHMRPDISKVKQPHWQNLIMDCWKDDPSTRPSFEDIIKVLEHFQEL
eukprot:Anaeramoba_ignava/a487284_35.p1 GENE.a487284_35~~a487284_35.p1  ORF type:complete len:372 (+),score=105.07 a487284_35:71-1117(+)